MCTCKKSVDLQQICYRSVFWKQTNCRLFLHLQSLFFKSVQVLPSSSGKMFDPADEKQMKNRSADDPLSLQRLQAVFSTHVHQFKITYY